LPSEGTVLRCASPGDAQTSRLGEDGGDEATAGTKTSLGSAPRIVEYNSDNSLRLSLTIKVGTRLKGASQPDTRDGRGDNDERSDSGFDDLLCDIPEPVLVGLVVALVNGKVESVGTVDLYVYQARAANVRSALPGNNAVVREGAKPEDVTTKVHNLLRPFFPLVERPLRGTPGSARDQIYLKENVGQTDLSIQNDAPSLVNPKILLHQLAVLPREETVREANETVGRRHSCPKETVERL
jgi:hypothetical protein